MVKKTSITLDCNIFGIQCWGGVSNYWSKLIGYISDDAFFESSILLPGNVVYRDFNSNWLQCKGVKRELLHAKIARYFSAPVNDFDDIFHTPYYRLPRRRVSKYIVTVHDFTYERYRVGLARLVHTRQKMESIKKADAVICVSETTRLDVIKFCHGIDLSKLHVIHHGVDDKVFYRDAASLTNEYEGTVLFVGQRGGYKRFDLAIESISESPDLALGIIGPKLEQYERDHLERRLGKRWREFGLISTTELRLLYSSAYALILPSDYEGFGLPILEAMACGCPVVAARLSSLPEIGGDVAYYAASQNGESYAAALNDLRSTLKRNNVMQQGMDRAKNFSWLNTYQKTKAIYLHK